MTNYLRDLPKWSFKGICHWSECNITKDLNANNTAKNASIRLKVTMKLRARVKESEAQMVFSLILPSRVKGSDQDRFSLQMKVKLHRWFSRRVDLTLGRCSVNHWWSMVSISWKGFTYLYMTFTGFTEGILQVCLTGNMEVLWSG